MRRLAIILIVTLLLCPRAFAINPTTVNISVAVNQKPEIIASQPADGFIITEGMTLEISVTADDDNISDTLMYQYYINGAVEQDWTENSTFPYKLENKDIGLNSIYVKVTDGVETVPTDTVEIYVFRSSPSLPE
ncbi:MAG: hypothetical protein ISS34_07175 [Candidatus Omnitrophica bacterium]|nr:hypothetical protein [Candidatus Omnitrophota bacterium]